MSKLEFYLPYAFVLLIALPFLFLVRRFLVSFVNLKERELKLLAQRENNEYRLQAFERLTLYLERIKPANLVTKFDKVLEPHEFVYLTEKTIREEFDYNASMQLYIGNINWNNIEHCQLRLLKLLQSTYDQLGEKAKLEDYKTLFLMAYLNEGDFVSHTIEELKKEFVVLHIK